MRLSLLLVLCSIRSYLCSRVSSDDNLRAGGQTRSPDASTLEGLIEYVPGKDLIDVTVQTVLNTFPLPDQLQGQGQTQVEQPSGVGNHLPDNLLATEPSLPANKLGEAFKISMSKWKHKNPLERPAVSYDAAKSALEAATKYLEHPDFPKEDKRFFADEYDPTMEAAAWPETPEWARFLTSKMLELPPGLDTDDHSGTPIGAGETIALVGARVQMDEHALEVMPEPFRTGLFAHCNGPCPKWPAAVRVSHTEASGQDIMRIALKFDAGKDSVGEVDLHFTETMRSFPIGDKNQLEAFVYSLQEGAGTAIRKFPRRLMKMAYSVKRTGWMYQDEVKKYGVAGKDFFSLTPYKIGGGGGRPASAMKWRLRPKERELALRAEGDDAGKDLKKHMREQFCHQVLSWGVEFDLEIQVATDPTKHPVNDVSSEWAEEGAPWIKVARVTIPQQGFVTRTKDLVGHEAVSSGLWGGLGEFPSFNSKELLFKPHGTSPHIPLGDVNAFRSFFYPLYDRERQEHLLGKKGGKAAECPFEFLRHTMAGLYGL